MYDLICHQYTASQFSSLTVVQHEEVSKELDVFSCSNAV